MNKVVNQSELRAPLGWSGQTLKEMLEKSERLVADTGRYYGLDKLELQTAQPILYEKIFSRLRGGLVNARSTALNISASPIVKEIGELSFAIYTPEGDSIALSTGIIVHVHTMSDAIKYMIRNNYEASPGIKHGYVFSNNNSMIGDVHTADVHTIIPIIIENELIGWAAGVTHEIDVGGVEPGALSYGHADRYGDGLLISGELVGENDEFYPQYLQRCRENVRAEMYWLLDEKTRLAGCQMVREQVMRTVEEVGLDTYKAFMREAIEEGRRSFLSRSRQMLVPGVYEAPSFTDLPWGEDPNVHSLARRDVMMHAPLQMMVSGEGRLELSFEGANKWGFHSFNCAPSPMQGAMWVLLTQTLWNSDKINDGAYFATGLRLPYGSWCNPDYEKVSTTLTWFFLIPGFSGMIRAISRSYFARGYVEDISASYCTAWNLMQGGGINHYGVPSAFTNFEVSCGGTGALYVRDGEASCAAMWNPEGDMGEVETWETLEPLIYLGRGLKPSTGGPGKYRGGTGSEALRMLFKTSSQTIFNGGEGHVFSSYGIFGGYPGNSGYRHNMHDTDLKERFAKGDAYPTLDGDPEASQISALCKAGRKNFDMKAIQGAAPFSEYDLYLSMNRGGPGIGDPIDRLSDSVARDVNEGHVLERFALSLYGVVLRKGSDGSWVADEAKTVGKRAEIRAARLSESRDAKDFFAAQRKRVLAKEFIRPVCEMYKSSMQLSPEWAAKYRSFWQLTDDWSF
jgi:N-methylhydantoinase B/oxoprolinase/acetone carboxylase alpha subunit